MSIFCLDYITGNDTTDGIGWWKVAYTNGTGSQPAVEETIIGVISGATGKVQSITGTWATSGSLYVYGKSGTFQAENLSFSGGAGCTIASDLSISC